VNPVSDGANKRRQAASTHVPSGDACSAETFSESSEIREIREMFLIPGRRFSYADIPAELVAKIAEQQTVEAERAKMDWPNLCRYLRSNRAVIASADRPRVVFLGDSITENWALADPSFFTSEIVCRGIGGQTTSQLVLRTYSDVVALEPRAVHILAGTNDIAGNNGPVSDDTIVDNIRAMIDIVQANGIGVILASILPAKAYFWNPDAKPAIRAKAINNRLRRLAKERGAIWANYYAKLADSAGGLPDVLGNDGVHPNRNGYGVMRPIAQRAISAV
jgi:lysophospholipase L1-like esterase